MVGDGDSDHRSVDAMPMVMVSPRVYEQGRGPVEPVMADLRKRYALTGLGLDCQYDPKYDTYVGDCG